MYLLLGLAGMGLPFQTGINALLKRRVGSPYTAALISFVVALIFLLLLLTATGQEWSLPAAALEGAPLWIWAGGLCGAIFLTGNILLHARLGSVQTIVLPVMGQILMGLIIDTYGYFHAAQTPLSLLRIVGAILVVGVIVLALICIGLAIAGKKSGTGTTKTSANTAKSNTQSNNGQLPWWIWFGGILGAFFVLGNVYLAALLGTGMTVVVLLITGTTGGLIVDHFGLFRSPVKPINGMKVLGIIAMIAGAEIGRAHV